MCLFGTIYSSYGQACPSDPDANNPNFDYCNKEININTDPDNPSNDECSNFANNFDWRVQHTPGGNVPAERYYVYGPTTAVNDPIGVRNPFNGPAGSDYSSFLTANHESNYQPEDGWELLKVEFGSEGNIGLGMNVPPAPNNVSYERPMLAYMMLYNKYSGTLRFFGTLTEPNTTYETVKIELRIPQTAPPPTTSNSNIINYQSDLAATNLLSIQGETVQPLDQETDETSMSVFVKYTNNPTVFFWFDLPVAYDPCICNSRSQLDVSFRFVQTADIDIEGTISGDIKTQQKSTTTGSQDYAKTVFGRTLAAGLSTAVAIKSGGAVVNFKAFTDLIDIAKFPGMSASNKAKLESLQNYLECSTNFADIVKKNYKKVKGVESWEKENFEAAQKIIDGNTKFYTSLTKSCKTGSQDNAATTITANIKASGTMTLVDEIADSRIELAMPGSNWADKQMQTNTYTDGSGNEVPAYPTYNKKLGTFALLETPVVGMTYMLSSRITEPLNQTYVGPPAIHEYGKTVYRMKLSSSKGIKYALNPSLDWDMENTLIQCRIAVKKIEGLTFKDNASAFSMQADVITTLGTTASNPRCEWAHDFSFPTFNTIVDASSEYQATTPFVPIDQVMDVLSVFSSEYTSNNTQDYAGLHSKMTDSIYIQFKIVGVSNQLGSNGEPNTFIQFFTFPVSVSDRELTNPYYSALSLNAESCGDMRDYLDDDDMPFLNEMFKPTNVPKIVSQGTSYNSDIVFSENETLSFDGMVEISAKMSTVNGKKVTIFSSLGFDIQPGAEIGSNIELVIGYPFVSDPIPPQTYNEVSSFCSNTNKYKAQTFASSALREEKEEYLDRQRMATEMMEERKAQKLNVSIYPNPTKGEYTLDFDYPLQDVEVVVLDLNGKEVSNTSFSGEHSKVKLDASALRAGVYFIDIRTPQGKIGKERLVKY